MKIVNLQQFLALPDETLFCKYAPCYMEALEIKTGNCGERDFTTQRIADSIRCSGSIEFGDRLYAAEHEGASVPMDFESQGRDGCFEDGQLFAVYERADVEALVARLQRCLAPSPLR